MMDSSTLPADAVMTIWWLASIDADMPAEQRAFLRRWSWQHMDPIARNGIRVLAKALESGEIE